MNKPSIQFAKACEKCGYNKWHTIIKGKKWRCRACGLIRESKK